MAKREALTDDQKIAAYLKRHKPTKCPTAFLAPSQHAEPTTKDAAAHAARGLDPSGAAWTRQTEQGRRNARIKHKRGMAAVKAWQTRRRNGNG